MGFHIKGAGRSVVDGVRFVKCAACGASGNPLPVGGEGKRKILVLLEQPTQIQWEMRDWFAGGNATVLSALHAHDLNLRTDLWVTAILPCMGPRSDVLRYEQCLAKLHDTIKQLHPRLIITTGSAATGAVLRLYNSVHYDLNHATGQLYGQLIPLNRSGEDWGCWLAPVQSDRDIHTYQNVQMQQVAKDWVNRAIDRALAEFESPIVNPEPVVELLYDSESVCAALDEAQQSKCVAFDYETNCLQPEIQGAKILTCALTYDTLDERRRTIAFPMASQTIRAAWCKLLQSDVPKIGANIKFEHRWSLVHLGTPVVNWEWDVCIGGRVLDCVPGNSGLKHLTFTYFGIVGYDDSVAPFMKDDGKGHNGLEKSDVSLLLKYNGYDAFWTMRCFEHQRKVFRVSC